MIWQMYILFHIFHVALTFYLGNVHNQPSSGKNTHGAWSSTKYPELKSGLYEGDILLLNRGFGNGRNAIKLNQNKWPKGTVPYSFNSAYSDEEKQKVLNAMRYIESKTCVKFVARTTQEDYIIINKEANAGCYAVVGYIAKNGAPLPVNLQSPECLYDSGTIQHELLHVLGLFHEQSRPDRDDYVTIFWDNIEEENKYNFDKAPSGLVTTFNVPYDYQSVMHYPRDAFSKNGKDTIEAKDNPDTPLGQRVAATESDLQKIRLIYKCPSRQSSRLPKKLYKNNFVGTEWDKFFHKSKANNN